MYKDVFRLDIKFDSTNNDQPSRKIQKLTGYRKNKTIFNYQVSHVFGKTKNIYCFTAPWNIVFIPKILDPLTGHEAIGDYVIEFKRLFWNKIYTKFEVEVNNYNEIISHQYPIIKEWVENNVIDDKFKSAILKEFVPIVKIE